MINLGKIVIGGGSGGGSSKLQIIPVSALPDAASAVRGAIYLVPATDTEIGNLFDEYIVVNGKWEKFGSASIDISNVVEATDLSPYRTGMTALCYNYPYITRYGDRIPATEIYSNGEHIVYKLANYFTYSNAYILGENAGGGYIDNLRFIIEGEGVFADASFTSMRGGVEHEEYKAAIAIIKGVVPTSAPKHVEGFPETGIVEGNAIYNAGDIHDLHISKIPASGEEAVIKFTTQDNVENFLTLPAEVAWIGELEVEARTDYVMSIKDGIVILSAVEGNEAEEGGAGDPNY